MQHAVPLRLNSLHSIVFIMRLPVGPPPPPDRDCINCQRVLPAPQTSSIEIVLIARGRLPALETP